MSSVVTSIAKRPLEAVLHDVAQRYPEALVAGQIKDIPRIAFNIRLVARQKGFDASLCDLGGGIGLFSVGCAASGMRATLVDDFNDSVNRDFAAVPVTVHQSHGVNVINSDIVVSPPDFAPGSFDAITSFDSIEHWHRSPKSVLHRALTWLKPGGLLVLGLPNCVNLRKRLTVPFGIGKWSSMVDWYETPLFRGHVREPDVDDLKYIARDLKLANVSILGRNWLGHRHRSRIVRLATRLMDVPLRAFPALCADIYLLGMKH